MSIVSALNEKILGLPLWLVALAVGGGLYWFAYRTNQGKSVIPGVGTLGNNAGTFGTVAAPVGGVLEINPAQSNGVENTQPGAALSPNNSPTIPNLQPVVNGGDNPFIGGYVGLPQPTPYTIARGGPS